MGAGFAGGGEFSQAVFLGDGARAAVKGFIQAGVGLPGGDFIHGTNGLKAGLVQLEDGLVIGVGDALDEVHPGGAGAAVGEAGIGQAQFIQLGLTRPQAGGGGVAQRGGDASAFDEVFEVLEREKATDLFGIFHCFTGDLDQAQKAISLGMKLGIGGVATFKNGKIDQFLHEIDLKNIVLETDSPYLAPVPHRGKRNESGYTLLVAQKLAEIYGLSVAESAAVTTENSKQIFGI